MRIGGYEFTENARFKAGVTNPDPKIIGEHLALLAEQHKRELTPQDVLDDARNPNSPLHQFFEWDDNAAAEQHRLEQARGLIRSVVAIYVREDKPAVRTRAFVHVPDPGAPHYRTADHAMSQERTRKMVLQRALRELQAWRKRYRDLQEFAAVFAAADETETKLLEKAKH